MPRLTNTMGRLTNTMGLCYDCASAPAVHDDVVPLEQGGGVFGVCTRCLERRVMQREIAADYGVKGGSVSRIVVEEQHR